MEEIEKNDFNLNILRYVSIVRFEEKVDLVVVYKILEDLECKIFFVINEYNKYFKEFGLKRLL